jgi:hypothetical protein
MKDDVTYRLEHSGDNREQHHSLHRDKWVQAQKPKIVESSCRHEGTGMPTRYITGGCRNRVSQTCRQT